MVTHVGWTKRLLGQTGAITAVEKVGGMMHNTQSHPRPQPGVTCRPDVSAMWEGRGSLEQWEMCCREPKPELGSPTHMSWLACSSLCSLIPGHPPSASIASEDNSNDKSTLHSTLLFFLHPAVVVNIRSDHCMLRKPLRQSASTNFDPAQDPARSTPSYHGEPFIPAHGCPGTL